MNWKKFTYSTHIGEWKEIVIQKFKFSASRYSKINLDIVLSCLNIRDNNRYNIYIQFSIQYEDSGVKNVKNLVLSWK